MCTLPYRDLAKELDETLEREELEAAKQIAALRGELRCSTCQGKLVVADGRLLCKACEEHGV